MGGGTRVLGSIAVGALVLLGAVPARAGNPAPTLADVVGHYEGTWSNTTAGSSGPAHIRLESDGVNGTIGFDMDGSVLGFLDPPELVLTAPLGSQSAGNVDSTFGNVSCQGNPASFTCTGSMSQNAPSLVAASITGSVAGDAIDTTYSLTFLGNQIYLGTLHVTKAPEPTGGGGVLIAALVGLAVRRRAARV